MTVKFVYLAGGMKSDWQSKFKERYPHVVFFDPSSTGLKAAHEYTPWDLDAISKSSLVVAHMETSNPGGYNLGLEIGYAHALDIPVWFIDGDENEQRKKYFAMLHHVAERVFLKLEDALVDLEYWLHQNTSDADDDGDFED